MLRPEETQPLHTGQVFYVKPEDRLVRGEGGVQRCRGEPPGAGDVFPHSFEIPFYRPFCSQKTDRWFLVRPSSPQVTRAKRQREKVGKNKSNF